MNIYSIWRNTHLWGVQTEKLYGCTKDLSLYFISNVMPLYLSMTLVECNITSLGTKIKIITESDEWPYTKLTT